VSALPRDFESSEQAHASQDRQAERRHDVGVRQDQLQDTANHDEAIETVEQRDEVALKTETRKRRFLFFWDAREVHSTEDLEPGPTRRKNAEASF
jgi:hypothetical protein